MFEEPLTGARPVVEPEEIQLPADEKMLEDLMQRRQQDQAELASLKYEPDFSSLDVLVSGYGRFIARGKQLENQLEGYKVAERLLLARVEESRSDEQNQARIKKYNILRRQEGQVRKALAEGNISALKKVEVLKRLAKIRLQIREVEEGGN